MKSISEIKNEFMQADEQALEELYEKYAEDTRSGVIGLIVTYKKKSQKCNSNLKQFYFFVQGYRHIFRILPA